MNYIELVNKFWTSHDEHQYTATEIALYFYLLRVFNTCMWKDTIKRNNRRVEVDLGISFYMLKNARNRLMQSGVISFKSQNGNANVSYSLEPTLQMVNEVTNEVTNEVEPRSLTRSLPTKDKPKPKDKPKQLHTNVCNNSTERLLTFVDEDWKELLTIWLDFKKSKGQTYKNENSVKILFNKLKRESDNDLEIAALMIEQSIANNWAGIFKIKDNGNKQSNRQYETTSERTEFARKIAEGIERGYKSREGNTNKQI